MEDLLIRREPCRYDRVIPGWESSTMFELCGGILPKWQQGRRILHNIWLLRERFEPEAVAREAAVKSRKAQASAGAHRTLGDDASRHSPPSRNLFSEHFLVYATELFKTPG